jgi:hypothetical protein
MNAKLKVLGCTLFLGIVSLFARAIPAQAGMIDPYDFEVEDIFMPCFSDTTGVPGTTESYSSVWEGNEYRMRDGSITCLSKLEDDGSGGLLGAYQNHGYMSYRQQTMLNREYQPIIGRALKFVKGVGWIALPAGREYLVTARRYKEEFRKTEIDCGTSDHPRYYPKRESEIFRTRVSAICPNKKITLESLQRQGHTLQDGYDGQVVILDQQIAVLESTRTSCGPRTRDRSCRSIEEELVCNTRRFQEPRSLEEACSDEKQYLE